MADLPSEWTHTPRKILQFRPGFQIADLDTDSSPGYTGGKDGSPEVQAAQHTTPATPSVASMPSAPE